RKRRSWKSDYGRRSPAADSAQRLGTDARCRDYGRQRPLGPRALAAPTAGARGRHDCCSGNRRRLSRRRRRDPEHVLLQPGELAAPRRGDRRTHGPPRDLYREGAGGAPRASEDYSSSPAAGRRGSRRHPASRRDRRDRGRAAALYRIHPRSRSPHPHLGRDAHLQLPVVAAGVRRAVRHARPMAGLHPARPLRSDPRASAPRPTVRTRHRLMDRNLAQRIGFAAAAIPFALGIAGYGGWAMVAFLVVVAVLGTRELFQLFQRSGGSALEAPGLIGAALLPPAVYLGLRDSGGPLAR